MGEEQGEGDEGEAARMGRWAGEHDKGHRSGR